MTMNQRGDLRYCRLSGFTETISKHPSLEAFLLDGYRNDPHQSWTDAYYRSLNRKLNALYENKYGSYSQQELPWKQSALAPPKSVGSSLDKEATRRENISQAMRAKRLPERQGCEPFTNAEMCKRHRERKKCRKNSKGKSEYEAREKARHVEYRKKKGTGIALVGRMEPQS